MTYLERENRSLTSLLDGQAEQLSRLKLEVARLKEFEQNLRVVSGMDAQADPMVGTGKRGEPSGSCHGSAENTRSPSAGTRGDVRKRSARGRHGVRARVAEVEHPRTI